MALFKKKKKKEPENLECSTVEMGVSGSKPEQPEELSEEAKKLMELIKQYKQEYYGVYRKEDFLELDGTVETANLLFAVFGELKKLNASISRALEEE